MKNKYQVIFENWDISADAGGDYSGAVKGCECFNSYGSAKKFAQDIALEGGVSAIYSNGECYVLFGDEQYGDELDNIALNYGVLKED